jgi:hypothetical protein
VVDVMRCDALKDGVPPQMVVRVLLTVRQHRSRISGARKSVIAVLQLQAVNSVTVPIRANMARRVISTTSLLFLSRERIFILALRPARCKFAKDRGWVIR